MTIDVPTNILYKHYTYNTLLNVCFVIIFMMNNINSYSNYIIFINYLIYNKLSHYMDLSKTTVT